MRYKSLGRTGLYVSELCLGTMTFGGKGEVWSKIGSLGQSEAEGLIHAAFDAGINFIDTADVYSEGRAEELTGQAIRNLGLPREELVIATKGFGRTGAGPNGSGGSRGHLLDAAKASLKRLQLDHVDLYQVHGFDTGVPMEETIEALDMLVKQGLVRYVGLSNWAAWQVAKAQGIAERRGFARTASLQSYYTLVGRDLERDIAPMLGSEGIGLMVWSPLAGGLLSGKYDGEGAAADGRRASFDFPPVDRARLPGVLAALREVAGRHDASVAQVALAWLLTRPHVTSVIVGANRPDQLADNIGAAALALSEDDLAALDAASALPPEYPGWMLARQGLYRQGTPLTAVPRPAPAVEMAEEKR
ncbi:MAG: aldo/keto reductase [Amaricoccus sp.]